jgi:tRNA-splicing ligase RtcB
MPDNMTIFAPEGAPHDKETVQQLRTCMDAGNAVGGVLCADGHRGYSQPIGGVVAYPDYISPSGVGYDIGCGNKAVATSLLYSDIRADLPRIMDEIQRRVAFGIGQPNEEEVKDHPVFDAINRAEYRPLHGLLGKARKQLGTVGAGNHYVDLFAEEGTDRVWIGVHFGSRGFGHTVASGFLALAQGQPFDGRAPEGEMDSPPVLLHAESSLGHMYLDSMRVAGEYAYAGRDVVVGKVLEILGSPDVLKSVHNHHNFAWRENHGGVDCWVVRKGATPLFPGQEGFVGASMGENAVIIEGYDTGTEFSENSVRTNTLGEDSLYSAPHGAGRVMSRTEAAGKSRKRWYCRSCGWTQGAGVASPVGGNQPKDQARCPSCKRVGNLNKKWVQMKKGRIDWRLVQSAVASVGVELRGGAADEAPAAYKRLPEVLQAHAPYVQINHQLRPIGVVMASADTFDPFKD